MQEFINNIKKSGAKKILLQLPEGMKTRMKEIVGEIEKHDIMVVISNKPVYGACDIADEYAKQAGCDLIVHIGHNKFYNHFRTEVPVLYYPWYFDIAVNADFSKIMENKIGLITSIQHIPMLDTIATQLTAQGKEAVIGGQILGCWNENAKKISNKVEAFLFIGSGLFHALTLKDKPVYVLDLETMKIKIMDNQKSEKLRWGRIYKARDAQTFGILVSSKKGQYELQEKVDNIAEFLKQKHKKVFVLIMDEITNNNLKYLKIDAFINTACPRIIDEHFDKPIINACDMKKLFEG